jgi:NTE family protein
MIHQEFEPEKIQGELRVGSVSLVTGEYIQFTGSDPDLEKAVLASTVMPIVWSPVDISPRFPSMVDGGIRNISPIGDVLDLEPDEIVIINCNPENQGSLTEPPTNIGKIGMRTLTCCSMSERPARIRAD